MLQTLVSIVSKKEYATTVVVAFLLSYMVVAWIQNGDFLLSVVGQESIGVLVKVKLILIGLWALWSIVGIINYVVIVLLALSIGVYIALMVYWIRLSRTISKQDTARGLGGAVLGFVGLGCAACGTLVIAPFLSMVGAAGLLAFLPLHGIEFLFIALAWMLVSIYVVMRKIHTPLVCQVD